MLSTFAEHPDTVILPLLAWVQTNQLEILVNLAKSAWGIDFEADVLDNSKVDLAIS